MSRLSLFLPLLLSLAFVQAETPAMYFSDSTGTPLPLAKDPVVIRFQGRYLMYYSRQHDTAPPSYAMSWNMGIAASDDLTHWTKIAEISPVAEYEAKGICAPGALVVEGKVHLFYQTYGGGAKDAICHAVSTDGLNFIRDESNPIFHPTGTWTTGRAIDAEVYLFKGRYLLYFATRDQTGKIQEQGVATAPAHTNFNRSDWTQAADHPMLKPEQPWEGQCVEGASVIEHEGRLYMFYAGSYNNTPQQIGVAVSDDGIEWQRLSDHPFLANGGPGTWNASESGHPCIFQDEKGRTHLFYQGNNDNGKTWYLSKLEIGWNKAGPYIIK